MEKIRKPELLIPASSLEVLKTAVIFGADAVYIGGEAFGLRAKAKNFTSGRQGTQQLGQRFLRLRMAVGRNHPDVLSALFLQEAA